MGASVASAQVEPPPSAAGANEPPLERTPLGQGSEGPGAQGAPPPGRAPEPARGPDDRRARPDYDGRPEPTTAADVALWVPRVLLFPLYLASEYALRRPLGWLVSTAELEHWPTRFIDFFTFGDRQGGIFPTGMIDFGMRVSFGLYAFWNDFMLADNDLRLRATFGGNGFWQLRASDRFPLGPGDLTLTGAHEVRPDNVFHGVGPEYSDQRTRYRASATRAEIGYRLPWFRSSHAHFLAELRQVTLDGDDGCCSDPRVNELVARGVFAAPPGMDQVYDLLAQTAEVVFDSRFRRFPDELEPVSDYVTPPGTGVRLALRARSAELVEQSLAPVAPLAEAWLHYGVSLGGHYDLTGYQRSVSLTAVLDFVDPLGSGEVPLTELVSLGGERPLRGFLQGQFVDRSAAAARLEYRWPVAVWLDGSLLYEAGNVFGAGLEGFDLAALRSSFGIGLAAVGSQDHPFQLLIALGTEPYGEGAEVDSFRFVFGTTAGF